MEGGLKAKQTDRGKGRRPSVFLISLHAFSFVGHKQDNPLASDPFTILSLLQEDMNMLQLAQTENNSISLRISVQNLSDGPDKKIVTNRNRADHKGKK